MGTNLFKNPPIKKTLSNNSESGVSLKTIDAQPLNAPTSETDANLFKPAANAKNTFGSDFLNSTTSSEQHFGKSIAQAGYLLFGGQKKIDEVTQMHMESGTRLADLAKKQKDPALKAKYAQMAVDEFHQASGVGKSVIGDTRTPEQIVGDALGVGMDVILSGGLNSEAKSFKLLSAADKTALAQKGIKSAADFAKLSTKERLLLIGKETLHTAVKGAGLGYDMDVSQNLQSGKEGANIFKPGMGTLLGGTVPLAIGGVKMGVTAFKNPSNGARVVNSLIKPLGRDFSYGKDPGKFIAEEGITANSFEDLHQKVTEAKQEIGHLLGESYSSVEGKASVDLSRALDPIDQAIESAQKTPEVNKALISRLEATKRDLVHYMVDPQNLTFAESVDMKGTVGDITKWTGAPSDDKTVNKALKQVYGIINDQTKKAVGTVDPSLESKIRDLSEKYGNAISAENAIKHRNEILQRQNLVGFTGKIATMTGFMASVLTGNIGPALAGVSEAAGEKALASTPIKTAVAAWMASQKPGAMDAIYKANPGIRNIIIKIFGKQGVQQENNSQIQGKNLFSMKMDKNKPTSIGKGIIDGYDIKSYATDPNHEKAVSSIYEKTKGLTDSASIDSYIKSVSKNSNVKAQDILDVSKITKVSPGMILAIIQQDSSFGTKGKGARGNNPGNVGNDDTGKTVKYPSMKLGLLAVARNLAKRKV